MSADSNLLCRICADINPINDDIFETNSQTSELIFKYLSISIDMYDEISTKICHKCKENIYNFHDFALECERAQRFIMTYKKNIINDFNCIPNLKLEFDVQLEVKDENKFTDSDDGLYIDTSFEATQETIVNEINEEIDPLKKVVHKRRKTKRLTPKKRKKTRPAPIKEKTNSPVKNEVIDDSNNTELHNDVLKINGKSINIKKEKITDVETIIAILEFSKNNNLDIKTMNLSRRSLNKAYMCEIFKFTCHICDSKFHDWNTLESHTKTKHKTKPEVMCICLKKLSSERSIQKHRILHNPDNHWRCNVCSKISSSKYDYNAHIATHQAKGPLIYSCDECEKKFSGPKQLQHHKKTHLPKELIWNCKLCDRKFQSQWLLKNHVKFTHEKIRPFICDTCGRSFTLKSTLIEHYSVHTDAMNAICEKCNKAFKTKKRLEHHMLTHSTVKYPCPHCPTILNSRATLKNHLLIHDENSNHPCPFCDKTFKRKKDVMSHKKLHTGERPFSCLWCPRKFAHASNCNIHKRRMHPTEFEKQERSRRVQWL